MVVDKDEVWLSASSRLLLERDPAPCQKLASIIGHWKIS